MAAAPVLFDSTEWQSLEAAGTFTGERLYAQKPNVYHAICKGLAERIGIRAIARAYKVSPNTIYAVMEREGVTIDTLKEQAIRDLRLGVAIGAERMRELFLDGDMKPGELAVALGISIEKLLLLCGEATSRVEVSHAAPAHASLNDYLASLPLANVQPTVLTGGNGITNSGDESFVELATADSESVVLPLQCPPATDSATDLLHGPGAKMHGDPINFIEPERGGGGSDIAGGGPYQSDQDSQKILLQGGFIDETTLRGEG